MYSPKCTKNNFFNIPPPPFWKEKSLHPCSLELQSAIHPILDNDCLDQRKSSGVYGVAISVLAYGHDQQIKLPGVLLALALGASPFFTLIILMFFLMRVVVLWRAVMTTDCCTLGGNMHFNWNTEIVVFDTFYVYLSTSFSSNEETVLSAITTLMFLTTPQTQEGQLLFKI